VEIGLVYLDILYFTCTILHQYAEYASCGRKSEPFRAKCRLRNLDSDFPGVLDYRLEPGTAEVLDFGAHMAAQPP
jgi:hypothetical protein